MGEGIPTKAKMAPLYYTGITVVAHHRHTRWLELTDRDAALQKEGGERSPPPHEARSSAFSM